MQCGALPQLAFIITHSFSCGHTKPHETIRCELPRLVPVLRVAHPSLAQVAHSFPSKALSTSERFYSQVFSKAGHRDRAKEATAHLDCTAHEPHGRMFRGEPAKIQDARNDPRGKDAKEIAWGLAA